jgi:hypothetical protein
MNFSFRGRRGGGAQGAAPTQGDEVRSMTLWSLVNGAMPPRHGAIGPPRDLAFRRSPTNGHETTRQANVATTNQDVMTAGMLVRGVTQDMSQHGAGPASEIHFQERYGSTPQCQGRQMQLGAMLHGQPGITQAFQHQGFTKTAGFVTLGQVPDTQAHQACGTGGLPGAGALSLAGGEQTPQQQGIQGTQGGPVAGTMAMKTSGGGGQAITG